jgi:hypothetical protein
MTKNWNVQTVEDQIRRMYWACTDPKMDGFVTWGCKQDLYRVKFLVDELLKKCPTYSVEADWLREQEAEKIVQILKNEL